MRVHCVTGVQACAVPIDGAIAQRQAVCDGVALDGTAVVFNQTGVSLTIQNGLTLRNGAVIDTAGGTNAFYGGNVYFTGSNSQSLGGNGEVNFGSHTVRYTTPYKFKTTKTLTIGPKVLSHGH